jgi:hypothetical protein
MTDADRYARTLGKGFLAVRGTLCSPATQDRASEHLARYVANQFRKDVPDLKGLYARASAALDLRNGLFGAEEALDAMRRSTAGTLGAEHFADCMQLVVDERDLPARIIEHLVDKAIESVVACVDHQVEYRTDGECQAAVRIHAPEAKRELLRMFEATCGLEPLTVVPRAPKDDQETILEFIVVPKE